MSSPVTGFDPFTKLISASGTSNVSPSAIVPKVKNTRELNQLIQRLPRDQGINFRSIYSSLLKAHRLVRSADPELKEEIVAFSRDLVRKLVTSDPRTVNFNAESQEVKPFLYDIFMRAGRVSEALVLYPDVDQAVRNDVRGLIALSDNFVQMATLTNLTPGFLKTHPHIIHNIQSLIGNPAQFSSIAGKEQQLRRVGIEEPLYYLLSQKLNEEKGGCRSTGARLFSLGRPTFLFLETRLKFLFPDFDYKIVDQLCAFADKFKNVN